MTKEIKRSGKRVNHKRIERIMKEAGIRSKLAKKFKATTNSKHTLPVAENLLSRDFSAAKPNQKMVSDITYLWTEEGWLYIAGVMDFHRFVELFVDGHHRIEGTLRPLEDHGAFLPPVMIELRGI